MAKKTHIGRPRVPEVDKLQISFRADFEKATDRAMKAEMKRSGQTRSQVMRRLVRDGLRAAGHDIPLANDEQAQSAKRRSTSE